MKKITLIVVALIFLFSVPVLAKQEVFVLYDATGQITGSARIDRSSPLPRDGSTMAEYIERKVSEGQSALYLKNGKLPDFKKQKVSARVMVDMTAQEIADKEAARPKSKIELLEERITVLEAK